MQYHKGSALPCGRLLSGLTLRLSVVGIPSCTINPFAELMVRWTVHSGEEWTVKRLKDLKIALFQQRAGLPITAPIARNRNGEIRGVVGSLMRWATKTDKNFAKVLNAFMAYSHWYSVKLTGSQKKKFFQAVTAPPVKTPEFLCSLLVRTTQATVGRRTVRDVPSQLLHWQGSSAKRAPTLVGPVNQDSQILLELLLFNNWKTWDHITRFDIAIYSHVFAGLNVNSYLARYDQHPESLDMGPLIGGEVHFLQEPGYKLRSIASPYRLFQVASEPLKNSLKSIVSGLPWDCTHDQSRAIPSIQRQLHCNKQVHSVDLSNATDYFPWELQEIVLETIYGQDNPYVALFHEISRATWHSELGDIQWTRGQPLGFNPSFFCFTLTHGLLLESLRRFISPAGQKWDCDFFVLGDDVVILRDDLYKYYIKTLDQFGCPYSKDKSISSCKLSEFAGKVVTPDATFPQLKWRDVSDDNFIDLARWLGPRIRMLLSRRQCSVLDVFAHIPDFISPFGLNWSFPGSNLDKMVKLGEGLTTDERVLYSLMGLSENVHNQLYADYAVFAEDLKTIVDETIVSQDIRTFDEKVYEVFLRIEAKWFSTALPLYGLKDIPWTLRDTLLVPQLPMESRPPSRVTLLQRLSRLTEGIPKCRLT